MEDRHPATESARGELVTVAVPARNEERFIGACLDSILAQEGCDLQVVVVDGASTDHTGDIVRSYSARDSRVELVDNAAAITPTSLNCALKAARGRWFVRVDAHSTVPSGYVARAVQHLASEKWAGVGGRKDGVGNTPAGQAIAAVMSSRFGVGDSLYHYGTQTAEVDHVPFGAYVTGTLRELGGWDNRLVTNQDFELDYRLRQRGHKLLFDPALRIEWHCRQSIPDLFRQYRRYGKGKVDVALLHPTSLRMRHLIPPLFVIACGIGAAAVVVRNRRVAAAVFLPYAAALTVASTVTGRKLQRAARVYVPLSFAAMHFGWGVGFVESLGRHLLRNKNQ